LFLSVYFSDNVYLKQWIKAEDRKSEVEDRMVEINEAERKKEKKN